MRAAGLTQGELAERSAIGRVTLVRIEKGEQSPRFNTLSAIAHTLELAVEDLLTLSCNRSMEIHDEIIVPGQEARHGDVPAWLSGSPVWPAVNAQTDGGQLYLHQAMGLDLLGQGHNLVISTDTASGKSLVLGAHPAPPGHSSGRHGHRHLSHQGLGPGPGYPLAEHGRGCRSGPHRHQPDRRRRPRPHRAAADPAAHPVGPDDPRRDPAVADGLLGAPLSPAAAAP